MEEPKITVGIMSESQIEFEFSNPYSYKGKEIIGKQIVT